MDKIFEGIHVLDGSLATELKKREVEINSKLWTAEALADNIEKIYDVHLDYLWSGAQMILPSLRGADAHRRAPCLCPGCHSQGHRQLRSFRCRLRLCDKARAGRCLHAWFPR